MTKIDLGLLICPREFSSLLKVLRSETFGNETEAVDVGVLDFSWPRRETLDKNELDRLLPKNIVQIKGIYDAILLHAVGMCERG